jgi:hypothetical protein
MNLTREQFDLLLKRPAIARANNTGSQSGSAVPKRVDGNKPIQAASNQGSHTGKLLVRVTSFRRRLLDEDNLVEKWHVDALRYAGILPSDAPGDAKIEVGQEKVATKEEEQTVITIEPLCQ